MLQLTKKQSDASRLKNMDGEVKSVVCESLQGNSGTARSVGQDLHVAGSAAAT